MLAERDRIDRVFDVALVLLGILAANEFQYFLTISKPEEYSIVFRVFTVPVGFLITVWIAKEIVARAYNLSPNQEMILTEFCWELWGFSLFYYLMFQNLIQTQQLTVVSVIGALVIVLLLLHLTSKAYHRTNRIMVDYFTSYKWAFARAIVYLIAFSIVTLLVLTK